MKRLLTVALLCASASAFAQDKTAPKPTAKTETKTETKSTPSESTNLKVEEPDQKDPKNKEVDTKAQGEVKKESF
ncbi:hypothetical protein [Stigmatella aurantiaca]|uniref:Uncharacterized protein n=1 Tax=Stigmatella aurantiaca (strain DW4/3-1) TaxID=378806 RepID=Q095P9_STIAD|nr:hypothetical protein [Stigmatella aurantiaca]ADO68356.1 uncharacterized protein STAUR_0552 [Stigmatella aurantiaca DW4/3-1]EAU67456.1 hypothetical protein STIAU_1653 [Stigmatella aurantiaca DW4/3-1]